MMMKALVLVCVLATITTGSSAQATDKRCELFPGKGQGGQRKYIGDLPKEECIEKCIKRKEDVDDSINGVHIYDAEECYCLSGMTYRDDNDDYMSCFLKIPDLNAEVKCELYQGDGEGGDEYYIGKYSKSECIEQCIKRKNEGDDSINGVTVKVGLHEVECYCEKDMSYRDFDDDWKSCFLRVPDVNADKTCALFTGDGKGGSEIDMGELSESECLDACIKKKNEEDDLINGMTIDSMEKTCYCEKGMKWRNDNNGWKSCFLRVPDPNADKQCELQSGDAEGGSETWMGYLTRDKCIEACIKRRNLGDDSINGVTVYADEGEPGCYCEKAMSYRDTDTTWKSCVLHKPAPVNPCDKNKGGCAQICTNADGTAQCSCRDGFQAMGKQCYDINECSAGTSGCTQGCINTPGSFKCHCFPGYKIGEDGKTCVAIYQYDVEDVKVP